MKLIDCQSHILVPEFAELLVGLDCDVHAERQDDAYAVHFGHAQTLRMRPADYDPVKKIADMDDSGIAWSILSPNIPGPEMLPETLRVPGARMCNDYMAGLCRAYPDRFAGLAVLPFGNITDTLAEYRRCIHQLGLKGVVLYSHLGGRPVDDPSFEPFYAVAAADGVPLVIHPTVPTWADAISDYSMIPMMGFMVDHSFAMLRLILGGVLERNPGLRIVHPHCGGILPYLMPRVDEQTEVKGRGREHIRRPPSSYYRDIYLDTVSPSPMTIRFALEFAGADRLLFGSDHPWIGTGTAVQIFGQMDLSSAERTQVGWSNAAALFGLPMAKEQTRRG
jgi:predicted TIM-barrel fold metal-dependent hydrolase